MMNINIYDPRYEQLLATCHACMHVQLLDLGGSIIEQSKSPVPGIWASFRAAFACILHCALLACLLRERIRIPARSIKTCMVCKRLKERIYICRSRLSIELRSQLFTQLAQLPCVYIFRSIPVAIWSGHHGNIAARTSGYPNKYLVYLSPAASGDIYAGRPLLETTYTLFPTTNPRILGIDLTSSVACSSYLSTFAYVREHYQRVTTGGRRLVRFLYLAPEKVIRRNERGGDDASTGNHIGFRRTQHISSASMSTHSLHMVIISLSLGVSGVYVNA